MSDINNILAPMLADITENIFGNNAAAAPGNLSNAHAMCACGPVTKSKDQNWVEFAYGFLGWNPAPEEHKRWREFLGYLKRSGEQYTEGYQNGYTAGANKAREDYRRAIESLSSCHNAIGNLLIDLGR